MTTFPPNLSHPKYRPDIDGLRAVAVLSVVGFHAFPAWLKGGFVGVDIFFVISGFLISTIIFENLESESFSLRKFYARRIKRIFPALLVVLFASLTFGWFTLLADEYEQLGKHVAAGSSFVSNLVLWREQGYFDSSAETKPLLHLWSLGIEEQFYIVWPVALWLAWKRKFSVPLLLLLIGLTSFALNVWGVKREVVAAFYSPQTRFWELVSGSALAWLVLYTRTLDFKRRVKAGDWQANNVSGGRADSNVTAVRNTFSFIGCALVGYGFWALEKTVPFPGWRALLPVFGAVLIILAGHDAWINRHFLSQKIVVWFGLISFPLYLWHWPLLSFATIFEGGTPDRNVRIGAVVLSVVLAWLTYVLIERPIRRGRSGRSTVPALVAAMAGIGVIGYGIYEKDGAPLRAVAKGTDANVFKYDNHWLGWERCELVPNTAELGGCRILNSNASIDVLVIGDSHAGHLASGLRSLFSGGNVNVSVMLYAGCFPTYPVVSGNSAYLTCPDDLITRALAYAINTPSVKTVVLSGYGNLRIQGNRFHQHEFLSHDQIAENLAMLRVGLDKTLSALGKAGKKVIFVVDNPELLNDPRSCLARLGPSSCTLKVPKELYIARSHLYLSLLEELKENYPEVRFTNTVDFFCDNEYCYGQGPTGLWYATRDHLTTLGSQEFVKYFHGLF